MLQQNLPIEEPTNISVLPSKSSEFLNQITEEIIHTTQLMKFKNLFAKAAKESKKNEDIEHDLVIEIQQSFRQIISSVNQMIYHSGRFTQDQCETVGQWIHEQFLPYCLLGSWPDRSWRKPQNIAGDHYTIKQIYQNGSAEKTSLGKLINHCFFNEPACRAVLNRKMYVKNAILEKIRNNESTSVVSVASGPAEEILSVYSELGKERYSELRAVGLDIDKRACAAVDDQINSNTLQNYFSTYAMNILKVNPLPANLKNQDLVYSMGLIDYFKDRATVKIINNMYEMLKPGGEIIIGNFHVSCESRLFLDYLLDWKLIYRTEDDMRRLFSQSAFGNNICTIDFEGEGVNMLVRCTKNPLSIVDS